jgi:hypothetical protein
LPVICECSRTGCRKQQPVQYSHNLWFDIDVDIHYTNIYTDM